MIPSSYFWLNIFFLTIGTIGIRYSVIGISGRVQITERTKEIFSFISAAIIPALIAPMVFFHQGHSSIAQGKERFVVLILTTVVCYFYRSTLVTILFGLVTLYIFSNYL